MWKMLVLSAATLGLPALSAAQSGRAPTADSQAVPDAADVPIGEISATAPLAFVAITPCRVADTRDGTFPAGYGPPSIAGSASRSFTLTGRCGVAAGALAVSVNFTATNTLGPGDIRVYPQGDTLPLVSTLNYLAGQTVANAAVAPLGVGGGLTVQADVSGLDLIIDVNGYYTTQGAVAAGVRTLNTLTGDVTLQPGTNVSVTPSGNALTISAGPLVTSVNGQTNAVNIVGTNGASTSAAAGTVTVTTSATPLNLPSTLVSRNGSGAFGADTITLAGNLVLPATAAAGASGVVRLGGQSFLHAFGAENTFVGAAAGNTALTGDFNTGVGEQALGSLASGRFNSALGSGALLSDTAGTSNSAFGYGALRFNTTGNENTGFGRAALQANITGIRNASFGAFSLSANTASSNAAFGAGALQVSTTGSDNSGLGTDALSTLNTGARDSALGAGALQDLTTGSDNLGLGYHAGTGVTTGSGNIYVGTVAAGAAAEASTIRIGSAQTATFVAGVSGAVSAGGVAVLVNPSGKLGTAVSSRRFKDEVASIDEQSDVVLKLRPVTFLYKPELDETRTRQYGLVAEEVAEMAPDLVTYDADGRPEAVRYHFVNALLLNEVRKQRRTIEDLSARLAEVEARLRGFERH
jgi:hypothetical protein